MYVQLLMYTAYIFPNELSHSFFPKFSNYNKSPQLRGNETCVVFLCFFLIQHCCTSVDILHLSVNFRHKTNALYTCIQYSKHSAEAKQFLLSRNHWNGRNLLKQKQILFLRSRTTDFGLRLVKKYDMVRSRESFCWFWSLNPARKY